MKIEKNILILGIGNILLSDDGVGIRVIERLQDRYAFAENVSLMDGGVLGLNLVGAISEADQVIVVDALKNGEDPGTLYRLDGDAIPSRSGKMNSLHHIGFPEILETCRILGHVPDIVVIGIEPEDIESHNLELTPAVESMVDELTAMVLKELDRLSAPYRERNP
ncbi:MAG: HyaD/HybD family hydrogenase maturation endopeptidase [Desulfatiglandales bacterium]